MKKSIKSHFWSKIGYLFMKKSFKELRNRIDVQGRHAGSPLLGCKKLVVKNHGGCNRINICASIEQTMKLHTNKLVEKIEQSLAKINVATAEE